MAHVLMLDGFVSTVDRSVLAADWQEPTGVRRNWLVDVEFAAFSLKTLPRIVVFVGRFNIGTTVGSWVGVGFDDEKLKTHGSFSLLFLL